MDMMNEFVVWHEYSDFLPEDKRENAPPKYEWVLVAIPTRRKVAYYTAFYDGHYFAKTGNEKIINYFKRGSIWAWAHIPKYEVNK